MVYYNVYILFHESLYEDQKGGAFLTWESLSTGKRYLESLPYLGNVI
jgi:hypothetical protein